MHSIYYKIIKLSKWALLLSPFGLFLILCVDNYILMEAEGQTFENTQQIPYNKVGLLLGTSKYLKDGSTNPYYRYRIEATVSLYKAQKIDFVLVSGDNGRTNYNEPLTFKNDLIKLGIPKDKIVLDYAGFSTLDSVIRAQKIFGLTAFTLISQKFHNDRAIFLANKNGINAIGYNAKTIFGKKALKTNMREYLARSKAFLDVIFKTKPKYLGSQISIR